MANGFVVDIPGAVERGLQFRQAAQLRPGEQQAQQLGLQRQQQQLDTGGLQQQALQQGIETEEQKQKSQNLFNTVARLRTLPDAQKIPFLQQNIADVDARGGDSSESRLALDLAQQDRFEELNAGLDNLFQTGVNTGFLKAQPTAATTSLQKNLEAAGLQQGTPEFQAAVLKATTKPQTVIGTGETEEVKALAKQRVARFGDIQKAADNATSLLDNLNQLDAIDVQTGALEPAKVAIAAVAEGFGIDASEIANATNAQAFNAVSGRLVNEVLNAATGPQTDQDADRARRTIATLGDTPGAAQFKNNSMRSVALRQVEQRDFIADQLDQDKNLSQANKSWREFKRKTPALSSVVKGPEGLPVFFYQFKDNAQQQRPGISEQEIIDAWRSVHAK